MNVKGNPKTSLEIRDELKKAINTVYQAVVNQEPWWNDTDQMIVNMFGEQVNPGEYYRLFANVTGLIDGNCYGLVLNGQGVAVGGFPTQSTNPGLNAYLYRVKVRNVHGSIREIPALEGGGVAQIDPVGAVFQTRNAYQGKYLTMDDNLKYTGNVISNAKVLVGKYKAMIQHLDVSRTSITPETIKWVEDYVPMSGFKYLCNGDGMFHVNKGVIGLKCDDVIGLWIKDCLVDTVINEGDLGSELAGDYLKSHPGQSLTGYNGASTRGMSLSSSKYVRIEGLRIRNCQSYNSECIGWDIMFQAEDCYLKDCEVNGLSTGLSGVILADFVGNPTPICQVVGFRTSTEAKKIRLKNPSITKVKTEYVKFRATDLDCQSLHGGRLSLP